MRKCIWIWICMLLQIQGAWLCDQYKEYTSPYIKVVCDQKMTFPKTWKVQKVDVWQQLDGVKLAVRNPMHLEYRVYAKEYHVIVQRLVQDSRVLSLSYRTFLYQAQVRQWIVFYVLVWIAVLFFMAETFRLYIPDAKKRCFQIMGLSLFAMVKKARMGWSRYALAAFVIDVLLIHGKILHGVPVLFCGIIGLIFTGMAVMLEVLYFRR